MTSITVKKLPVDPGPAGWDAILPNRPDAVQIEDKITSDWLVIGAGFAGLAAARRLSQLCPTDRIAVLDAKRVAEGPAGRNSGFMIDLPHDLSSSDYGGTLDHDKLLTADNRHAIDFAAAMADEFSLDSAAFSRSGKVNAAATPKGAEHNTDYAAHLTAMGEAHEMLDASDMKAMTGTDYYIGGLSTPGTAIIQPAAFIRGVATGLASNRLRIYENSPVTELTRNGQWLAKTPTGSVTAPKVILAVNGHLNSFGFLNRQLMHVFTYASMTRPLSEDEANALGGQRIWGLTPADPLGSTIRRISTDTGDRIVVRNRFTFDPSMEVSQARIDSVAKSHDRSFAARFPMLSDVTIDYRWGGRLCLSRNNVSVVREVEDGLYTACCQNGLGTTRGTLSGILAAELATDTSSERLTRAITAADPTKLPPAPIAQIGASAHLKWHEMKAGKEL